MDHPLFTARAQLQSGVMTKHEYNAAVCKILENLYAYAEFMRGTGVGRIEITDGQVVMDSREGVRFVCDPKDKHQTVLTALNFGSYEKDEADLLDRMVRPDFVAFDVGANMGWYALHLARRLPAGRVLAFEPIPETFDFFRRNIALNGATNVVAFNFGMSEKEGELRFFYYPSCSGGTSSADTLGFADAREVTCRVRRLDDVQREVGAAPDLLKIDVEGAELFVIRGGLDCIRRHRPIIYCEMLRKWSAKFGYSPNDIMGLLAGVGYRCYEADGKGGLCVLPRMEETTVATNFFFLHTDKHADLIRTLVPH
jgi:FkbM family methyltransferase